MTVALAAAIIIGIAVLVWAIAGDIADAGWPGDG